MRCQRSRRHRASEHRSAPRGWTSVASSQHLLTCLVAQIGQCHSCALRGRLHLLPSHNACSGTLSCRRRLGSTGADTDGSTTQLSSARSPRQCSSTGYLCSGARPRLRRISALSIQRFLCMSDHPHETPGSDDSFEESGIAEAATTDLGRILNWLVARGELDPGDRHMALRLSQSASATAG